MSYHGHCPHNEHMFEVSDRCSFRDTLTQLKALSEHYAEERVRIIAWSVRCMIEQNHNLIYTQKNTQDCIISVFTFFKLTALDMCVVCTIVQTL